MKTNRPPQQSLMQEALEIIRRSINGMPYRNQTELAKASGESEANISRWLSGTATPILRRLEPVLMCLGVRLSLPGHGQACITQSDASSSEDLLRVDSWQILDKAENLRPLIMLRMPKGDRSMQPLIHPGDILVIDTLNRVLKEKSIYLVAYMAGEHRLHTFRRAVWEDSTDNNAILLSPDNIQEGYRPMSMEKQHGCSILGTVKHIIKKA